MKIPSKLKYTEEHEWVAVENDLAVIGITDYAQSQLGDLVHVELPEVGETVTQMEPFGTVEAVKAASDLYAPVSGTVVEINSDIMDRPELVNKDPYGTGWLIKVRMSDPSELDRLLSAEKYQSMID